MSSAVTAGPPAATAVGPDGSPAPVTLRPWASYRKDDVVEVCGALALAEVMLRRLGQADAAARMAEVFELVEAGLTE